jgi:two-component system alkaline phosphatase synthesis response regulator PhoP
MLPDMDGITVCETIRMQHNDVPILFLSARNSSADRVEGLKKGGDDYLTKPFNLEELLLRVDKLVTKNKKIKEPQTINDVYEFDGCVIDFGAHECVDKDGEKRELSKKEAALLRLLTEHEGEVVSREQILQIVWGYNVYPTTRTIDNFILNFRKFFERDSRNPRHFHSIRGIGYKFTK